MKQRMIAVLLLASLSLASVPALWASAYVVTVATTSHRTAASAHDHSCCPGHRRISIPILLSVASGPMPCGNNHPCCAKPAPENPASLPASGKSAQPDSQIDSAVQDDSPGGSPQADVMAPDKSPFRLSLFHSTVLRI